MDPKDSETAMAEVTCAIAPPKGRSSEVLRSVLSVRLKSSVEHAKAPRFGGALGAKVGEASKSPKQAVVTPKKLPLKSEKSKKRLQQRSIFKDPKRMGEVGILPLDFGIRFWDS